METKNMFKNSLASLFIATLLPVSVHAADCPSSDTANKGFVLENNGARSEFRKAEGQIVKTVNHFSGSPQQTVFSFAGLFDLARFSKNEQYAMHPLSDLSHTLPLKKGARIKVAFLPLGPDEHADTLWSLELTVAGQESFSLGECTYKVLRIKQVIKRGDEQVDILSVLYSPDLQATLAKVYDEGTANEYTSRYDRIQSLTQ
ncbi:hypothetical protein [Rhizobium ecuadorense]|uniref:hypothetical protein n=1 Tax=Rhizobium ecuadorense TaxID=1671795 RepID=UPI001FCCC6B5|nr:hypothetical protein [Rhizobium ecuadorense]